MSTKPDKITVLRQIAGKPRNGLILFDHRDQRKFTTMEDAEKYAQKLFAGIRDRERETIYIEIPGQPSRALYHKH